MKKNLTMVQMRPTISLPLLYEGMDAIHFDYYYLQPEYASHYQTKIISGSDSIKNFLHLLKEKGLYQKMKPGWFEDLLEEDFFEEFIPEYPVKKLKTLDRLLPTHSVNICYRVTVGKKEVVYLGTSQRWYYPAILLYKNHYYVTKNSFYPEMDSLLGAYLAR
ncbi:MAG: hypothetical protein R3C61_28500 [Bacteroidia bacterium]